MSALATTPAPAIGRPPFEVSRAPAPDDDKRLREQRRQEAERWLASLPRTTVYRRSTRGRAARLVMHRAGASTPPFWEAMWRVSPSFRMRGYKLPAWYRDIFLRWLPRDGLIVEAGCGNGNLLRMLVNQDPDRFGNFARVDGRGACVEGLDFAADAIAESRRIHPEGRYRVGDLRRLPYGDGELSAYTSMGVVEHFDERERAVILAEASRCLRPGGVAIITVPYLSPLRRLRALLGGYPDESTLARTSAGAGGAGGPGDAPALEFYQFYFTLPEIRDQVAAAGLRVVEVDGYDCRAGFTDVAGGDWLFKRLEKRSRVAARLIDHPPRLIRRLCPHMLMLVAVKP